MAAIDQNKLQRLCRRARARGLRLWGQRDGYHRSIGLYRLFQTEDDGQSWKAIFGPTTLDAIDARLASIPTLKRHVVVAQEIIDLKRAACEGCNERATSNGSGQAPAPPTASAGADATREGDCR
jgi:hypothetical protein